MGVVNFPSGPRDSHSGDNAGSPPAPPSDMEARVAKLEEIAQKTNERLAAIEARLNFMATKDELHKAMNEQTWRIVGAMITFGSLLATAVFFIARNVH